MPLPLEGPRPLSPLEQEAFRLVFWDSIDPCDVYVTVFDDIYKEGGYYSGAGSIQINRSKFLDANLHMNSTHTNTDILKPANIRCLSTLIHECTHHWQWTHKRYQWSGPGDVKTLYAFTRNELTEVPPSRKWWDQNPWPNKDLDMLNLLKEQHAAAAQVYFVIKWQLEHLPEGSDVNLSYKKLNRVGTVDRYHEIRKRDNDNDGQLIVSRDIAEDLTHHFSAYLVDLRSGGQKQWAG